MTTPRRSYPDVSPDSFAVLDAESTAGIGPDCTGRFLFRVPPRWISKVRKNPFAAEAERRVLSWFQELGCTQAEVARARKFDAAGYVGIPFPSLSCESAVTLGKYLSLWLLWDDVQVETLENRWRIEARDVLSGRRPAGMTRFDEGWWQLMRGFAARRSPAWIEDLCAAMATWNAAAIEEAVAMQEHRARGASLGFYQQVELRIATIGMYATVYLLEDAYGVELPRAFHASPKVVRLKALANKIVGLGNDILSFGKDYREDQINLVTTLMHERNVSIDAALERLVRMHDDALEEFDAIADTIEASPLAQSSIVSRWLQDVRYASLGFSLWESQAPRYTAYKVVHHGLLLEPRFPPPPSSSRRPGPPSARRYSTIPPPPVAPRPGSLHSVPPAPTSAPPAAPSTLRAGTPAVRRSGVRRAVGNGSALDAAPPSARTGES